MERQLELEGELKRERKKNSTLQALIEEMKKEVSDLRQTHQGELQLKDLQMARKEREHTEANGETMRMLTSTREQLQGAKFEIQKLNDELIERTQISKRKVRDLEARMSRMEECDDQRDKEEQEMFKDFRQRLRNLALMR
eukprot:CAMPEP_0184499154 /NCGR_PEP_ID=MMETSP0113_2-20130426/40816_1 /TAXON_ID=91329 /ORGANISM="Norrisiella sphaerica, Strain BC52" /LENGTH=139 /DNA_ID=CAMNT_0026886975 /DNA_START=185 /DNA_END=600 /DNA_ORIENTATION=+